MNFEIIRAAFIVLLPLPSLTIALLVFIWWERVDASTLLIDSGDQPSYILTRFGSTRLTSITSWMSSLAPSLVGFTVILLAYWIAAKLLKDSDDGNERGLLTPFQLSLVADFMSGSTWNGMWTLLKYGITWRRPRARWSDTLVATSLAISTMLLLSLGIFATDTWLHFSTRSVNVIQVSRLTPYDALYGMLIEPQCLLTDNSFTALRNANLSCSINSSLRAPTPANITTILKTLDNQSDLLRVLPYLGDDSDLFYLAANPTSINASYDYTSNTYAVRTTCNPISRACGLVLNDNATFSCNNGSFRGTGQVLSISGVLTQSYRNYSMSDCTVDANLDGFDNPFFTAGAAMNQLSTHLPSGHANDPNLAVYHGTVIGAVFYCNTTVYDAQYTMQQGQPSDFQLVPSNATVTNMFASNLAWTSYYISNMGIDMTLAASVTTTAQSYADAFAKSVSKATLAGGSASIHLGPILSGSQRETILVSKVYKPALWTLTSFAGSIFIVGVILSLCAMCTSRETKAARQRFSIQGMVALLFEGEQARRRAENVEELYNEYFCGEEKARIKFCRTSMNGLIFRRCEKIQEEQGGGMDQLEEEGL